MGLTRRQFLKLAAGGSPAVALGPGLARHLEAASIIDQPGRLHFGQETTTICPFCGCGCGFLVRSENGQVVNIEGDPDHPVNAGSACSKGSAIAQIANNPMRLQQPLHREPGSADWKPVSWDWAIERIARRIKATRDSTWRQHDDVGHVVNRTDAIASLGGASLDNEECYLLVKLLRTLGLVYVEHQARL